MRSTYLPYVYSTDVDGYKLSLLIFALLLVAFAVAFVVVLRKALHFKAPIL
jgi:hypothetical protein